MIVFSIQSSYSEADSSRYRLQIADLTIVDSLRNQTDRDFCILLEVNDMDPFLTQRIDLFATANVPVYLDLSVVDECREYTMVTVGDDDCISPEFVSWVRAMSGSLRFDRVMNLTEGYVWINGIVRLLKRSDVIRVQRRIVGYYPSICENEDVESSRFWVHVRHTQNLSHETDEMKHGREVKKLDWPVRWNLLSKFCPIHIITASANGSIRGGSGQSKVRNSKSKFRKLKQ